MYIWKMELKLIFVVLNILSFVGFNIILDNFVVNWIKIYIFFFYILNIYFYCFFFY